ncbi:MAG TPA: hypothetical protein VGQ27_14965 [Steroidobacteraceae bacterium]|jgi:hypothetical protein|nr:hypothetical protein [Steroidobacteraceae bacterium]
MRSAAALLAVLWLAACGSDSEQVLYRHDFADGSGGWRTVHTLVSPDQLPVDSSNCFISWLGLYACTLDVPVEGGRSVLQSPWWLDPNHAKPGGYGHLNLLTWVYLNGMPGSSTEGMPSIDLRDVTLRVSMRAQAFNPAGGRLVFWFQTKMPDGRFANFAYTSSPLDAVLPPDGSELSQFNIKLVADPAAWTCLGAAVDRSDFYGCMDVVNAMSAVKDDFGFIIIPVSDSPDPAGQPMGRIEIQSIELVRS